MTAPLNRLDIINRRATMAALSREATGGTLEENRAALVHILKTALDTGTVEIRRRFMEDADKGISNARARSYLIDQLLRLLYDYTLEHVYPLANPTIAERIALVATGGYGRGELAPYSDIDLMFLTPYKAPAWAENVAEFMLYVLWDLHLKVGHATRSPLECIALAKRDITIRTSLLESRFLWGDKTLYDVTGALFINRVIAGSGDQFVEDKLNEREARHRRMGDSRYVVEPNIKDGKGSLRDLHTMWWITRHLYGVNDVSQMVTKGVLTRQEYRHFRKAESFLMTVRVALHYLAGRAEERLTFDMQRQLAELLHYRDHPGASGVERFMKHYFLVAKEVGDLTRVFCAVLEEREQKKPLFSRLRRSKKLHGFRLDNDRLNITGPDDFKNEPERMLEIFQIANRTGRDIHPQAMHSIQRNLKLIDRKLRRSQRANEIFMSILAAGERTEDSLRKMNEAGVFGRFIPDFGRVVAQMQYDMYHHYTVDEHTIRAIGLLSQIETGQLSGDHPVASEIVPKIVSKRVLYVSVLLHDIAKGRGGNHSVLGAEVAEKLCPRLGLSPAETETVAWLVLHHLSMSHTAFKRDLSDHKTILDFAALVQSPERLKLLLALTVVDIRAVGPGVWNGWKGQLLRDLYYATEEVLMLGHARKAREERVSLKKDALSDLLPKWSKRAIKAHMARFSDAYWIAEEPDVLVLDAELMAKTDAAGDALGVATRIDTFQARTTVAIYTQDHPGLFARMAGALGMAGASIVGARVHTTRDGMAIDNFVVQSMDTSAFNAPDKLARLEQVIMTTLKGRNRPREKLGARRTFGQKDAAFHVQPAVIIDNSASNRSTVIEINAKDRPGLLYDLAGALYHLKLSIFSAHVATYGERAVDVFYVRDLTGQKLEHKVRLRNIETKMLRAAKGEPLMQPTDTKRKKKPVAPVQAAGNLTEGGADMPTERAER